MLTHNHKKALIQKIRHREAIIGVIGLGYVGLPLVLRFSEKFQSVLGFDTDSEKVTLINRGRSYIRQIQDEMVVNALANKLTATVDLKRTGECDVIIICVPTPLTIHFEPDLSFVRITTESILPFLKADQLLVLESTTFPGTTEELIAPRVEAQNFEIGENFFLAYSPEREDPGNAVSRTHNIPKVVGGHTVNCKDVACELYRTIIDKIVPVSSTKVAEMTKLLENIHRAVNIGLVNEMKMVADKMGINIHEVIDAAATKPFGFTKYSPGPGLGGHCIPIDPFYLTWKAKEFDINTRFIELSGEINRGMPKWVVSKLADALNHQGKPIKSSKILVLGIAYKKNIDDARESPSVKIMELLRLKGAEVAYSDPHIPVFPKMRDHKFNLSSIDISNKNLKLFDALVLATDHEQFDYKTIGNYKGIIIDTRNKLKLRSNVISA